MTRLLVATLASICLYGQQYFPSGAVGKSATDWYSQQLRAMQAPSLLELSTRHSKAEAYRFTWLRSFHHPTAVRLEILPDGTANVTSKMGSGKAGYEPGKIIVNRIVRVTQVQVQTLIGALSRLDFWNLPTMTDNGLVHVDGAQWLLEGVKDGRYHVVDRWSPDNRDPLREFELTLVTRIARIQIPKKEIY